jgi:putative transposase
LTVCRYVERNALRANLVAKAQAWPWCSLGAADGELLDAGPGERSANWLGYVNRAETDKELTALRYGLGRGCPFGAESWRNRIAVRLDLESTLQLRGRPRKPADGSE